ncbi:MAG: rod shape-determining protein RodA [Cyanobacteria bacterium J083]|nr:MAG: rod shape-determining protein RodA [Cyanobacteria bacterium J083]
MLYKTFQKTRWQYWLKSWLKIDWFLLICVVGMTALGGLMIHSTELNQVAPRSYLHWLIGTVGFVISLVIARFPYQLFLPFHWLTYALTNFALLAVIFLGRTVNGAQSWISLGGFNLQPSEFAKVGLIITLAALLHKQDASSLKGCLRILIVTAIPWVLIMAQPDLGTGLVLAAITLGMLFWANINPGWLLLLISPLVSAILFNTYFPAWLFWAIAVTVIAWFSLPWKGFAALSTCLGNIFAGQAGHILWNLLKPYQKDRLTLFLNPEKDPLGGGYHLIQSRIAISSGEIWGKGLFHGSQTQLNFIPEQHTDFIFSVVGEELGLVGCLAVITLIWLICLRLIYIACTAKENFGSLLAIGVVTMIAFQSALNISMTIGLAPITGIPLPFMSYGGSSLLTNFIAIGIVVSVANHRAKK